eukprot:4070219-Amphidinium_carterae.1
MPHEPQLETRSHHPPMLASKPTPIIPLPQSLFSAILSRGNCSHNLLRHHRQVDGRRRREDGRSSCAESWGEGDE